MIRTLALCLPFFAAGAAHAFAPQVEAECARGRVGAVASAFFGDIFGRGQCQHDAKAHLDSLAFVARDRVSPAILYSTD